MQFDDENMENAFVDPTIIIPEDPTDQNYLIKSRYEQIANGINAREIAVYDIVEQETGQQWFTTADPSKYKLGYRKVIQTGAIAGVPVTVAHGITSLKAVTHAWGNGTVATPLAFHPLEYADVPSAGNTAFIVTTTNVIVTPDAGATALNDSQVVIEYLKE